MSPAKAEIEIRHVVPLDDLKEHVYIDMFCECAPRISVVDEHKLVVIHHAYDQRERWEHITTWTLH
jgi:hypothetical protein